MTETVIPKRIGFKSVFVLIASLSIGMLLLSKPLMDIGLAKDWSIFGASAISAAVGLILVLLKIEGPIENPAVKRKRIVLAIILSIVLSFVLAFVAK
ncbi:hypothetical protein [Rossellomorea sp. BNER]|uniref:hypothetical protein n=1 Tax=Rossellomorea sp. BNER TaxID=2962031 RepID=UPI003AF2B549|nr:hypothetical protein [Rossellomorea sp. BNER]